MAVGAGLGCAFDVKGDKCVTETTEGLTLATDKKSCTTLLAAEKAAAASKPIIDARVTAAAEKAFSKTIQDHIFVGSASKKSSGRHILSAWTKANPAKSSPEQKRDKTTGVVEFKNGKDIKTVWNDVTGEGAAAGTFVYTEAQIKALCLRGYEQSILKNPPNVAILKAPATEAAGKKKLEITKGLDKGFVVHNAAINKNVCINKGCHR
ncbi:hypothetical protein C8F01DRAFT_1263484 [Mycena amicta]|nr:hypothetical protein C8F01DRAFT_1263484 [Mycena amicta]